MKRKSIAILLMLIYSIFLVPTVSAETRQIEDELIYKIIVDRYNNIDHSLDERVDIDDPYAYHGGDLAGVQQRLDDLASIGVSVITLSPIMQNADKGYHGYWIQDFTRIQDSFGTMEELEQLIEAADEYDIKIVLEFVTNYVHETHPIVQDEEKSDWILTEEVSGPAWTDEVVQLDQEHPEVQEFITEAATYWLNETNIGGLMLHAIDQSSPAFIETLTMTLKDRTDDVYVLGDVLDKSVNVKEMYQDTAMDAIDNYVVSEAIAEAFRDVDVSPEEVVQLSQEAGEQHLIFVDDQYTKRFTHQFSENQRNALTTWSLALTYMYTTPGIPVILQGSELSMYGENAENSQRLVPFHSGDPEVKEFYERVSSLKNQFESLRHGDFELIDADESMVVYKRSTADETLYIAINNGSESNYIDVPGIDSDLMLRGYLGDNIARVNDEGNHRIGIPRESAEVYEVVEDFGVNWGFISIVVGIMLIFVIGVILLTIQQKKRERLEGKK